ncbi:hypothetical protein HAX54_012682, partial [Datura stramonium]|nr:hypothetical protein [Datura stramonium]
GPSMKRPLEIGKARDGLYFLCSKCHTGHSASFNTCNSVPSLFSPVLKGCNPSSVNIPSLPCERLNNEPFVLPSNSSVMISHSIENVPSVLPSNSSVMNSHSMENV